MRNERPAQQLDALLTERQAAEFLNVSERTLQSWRARRVGPAFVKSGRVVRYRLRDLLSWIDANTVPGSCPAVGEKNL